MNLWASNKCADWHAALDRYAAIIEMQHVNGLVELDVWYRNELRSLIAARSPAYITRDELEQATKWKMKRGVWRERNRLLVLGNDAELVKKTSLEAFAAIPDPRKPVGLLTNLAGVGPATASAVLACIAPEVYPFFDELVATQIPDLGKVAFTPAYYQRYAEQLRQRTEQLRKKCEHRKWTAQQVSQALWSASGGKAVHEMK